MIMALSNRWYKNSIVFSSDDDSPPESSSTGSEIELEEVDNTSNYSEENNNNEVSWPQAKWQCFVSGKVTTYHSIDDTTLGPWHSTLPLNIHI